MTSPKTVRGFRRIAYFGLAGLFFSLGFIGILLPGLPTTPFLLLTSFFLIRASPKLHSVVLKIPYVGEAILDWEENRGVRLQAKAIAFVMIAAVIGFSLANPRANAYVKTGLIALSLVGILVVWRLPTLR